MIFRSYYRWVSVRKSLTGPEFDYHPVFMKHAKVSEADSHLTDVYDRIESSIKT